MVEIKGMCSGYDGKIHLEINELVIRKGEMLGILGKNGSGKSTLLRSLVGILPYEGSIMVSGRPLSEISRKERAMRIAYLPQQLSMPKMSVYLLASHGRFARMPFSKVMGAEDKAAVETALKAAGMWEMRHHHVDELSGGERQLAYLAMVLAQEADILLLDEPTASLDIEHQISLMHILRELADQGTGIVVTSHDIPQSFCFCDRICMIKDGKEAAQGTPGDLAEDPALLKRIMGISLVKVSEGLYPYVLETG